MMVYLAIIILALCLCREGEAKLKRCDPISSDWSTPGYAANIRDQGSSTAGWAFATVAYLESAYAIRTRNQYMLSVGQIIDAAMGQFGNTTRALEYVKNFGIMAEHEYPTIIGGSGGGSFAGLYDSDKVTPISVKSVLTNKIADIVDAYDTLVRILRVTPVIAAICSSLLNPSGLETIVTTCKADQSVLIVSMCIADNLIYAKYQNSWGIQWGDYGGYGYMYVGDSTSDLIEDNRGILTTEFTFAIIGDSFPPHVPVIQSSEIHRASDASGTSDVPDAWNETSDTNEDNETDSTSSHEHNSPIEVTSSNPPRVRSESTDASEPEPTPFPIPIHPTILALLIVILGVQVLFIAAIIGACVVLRLWKHQY